MANPPKLGKGLSALMAEEYSEHTSPAKLAKNNDATEDKGGLRELPLDRIRSGKYQPRYQFDERYLQELADSIAKSGVMQPIVVRPIGSGKQQQYEIIAGERRWRAAKLAGQYSIPVIVKNVDDKEALELALIENVQRQDLTPLEEGQGYQRLMDEFSYTQEELSATLGKSRSHIANLLRLLNLPDEVKAMLEKGELTMGHARALMNSDRAVEIAQEVLRRGLNVRQTENLARAGLPKQEKKPRAIARMARSSAAPTGPKDADILALEESLSESLGMPVVIQDEGQRGKIILAYETLEQLDEILRRLGEAA